MSPALPRSFQRYVALGDSSTEGLDDPDGRGGYRGWSQRLAERLAEVQGGLAYANLAVRGLTTAEVRARQLDAALALKPDLATLFCGTNDVTQARFDADQRGGRHRSHAARTDRVRRHRAQFHAA
jgi:lysophospholipase L1-like esterase